MTSEQRAWWTFEDAGFCLFGRKTLAYGRLGEVLDPMRVAKLRIFAALVVAIPFGVVAHLRHKSMEWEGVMPIFLAASAFANESYGLIRMKRDPITAPDARGALARFAECRRAG